MDLIQVIIAIQGYRKKSRKMEELLKKFEEKQKISNISAIKITRNNGQNHEGSTKRNSIE